MLLIVSIFACGSEAPPSLPVPPPPTFDLAANAANLNVIVISVDSLRFDRTGLGGSKLTPNLDRLQRESVAFTNATAAAPWTVPSHMAIFTGRWPTHHGVVNKLKPGPDGKELVFMKLADEIPTFPDLLVKGGWKAVAFTGGAGVSAKFGYNRGAYESYLDDRVFAGFDYSAPPAMAWLDAHAADHFFMFLHGYDAHGQHPLVDKTPREAVPTYAGSMDGSIEEQAKLREAGLASIVNPGDAAKGDVSAEDAAFLMAVYDAKVAEADARVGVFMAKVKALGLLDKSIVVVISDHGEEFMEHGYLDHGATLCEHQLHVPLSIRFPGGEGARVVETPVRTIDMFPTVFDALGVALPPDIDGKSLLPLLAGEAIDLPIHAESDYRLFVHLRSSRVGADKLILDLGDGQRSLYDLAADPEEITNRSVDDAKTTYEMEQDVRGWMGSMGADPNRYLNTKEEHIKLF